MADAMNNNQVGMQDVLADREQAQIQANAAWAWTVSKTRALRAFIVGNARKALSWGPLKAAAGVARTAGTFVLGQFGRLGRVGLWSSAIAAATNPKLRGAAVRLVKAALKPVGWVAKKLYQGIGYVPLVGKPVQRGLDWIVGKAVLYGFKAYLSSPVQAVIRYAKSPVITRIGKVAEVVSLCIAAVRFLPAPFSYVAIAGVLLGYGVSFVRGLWAWAEDEGTGEVLIDTTVAARPAPTTEAPKPAAAASTPPPSPATLFGERMQSGAVRGQTLASLTFDVFVEQGSIKLDDRTKARAAANLSAASNDAAGIVVDYMRSKQGLTDRKQSASWHRNKLKKAIVEYYDKVLISTISGEAADDFLKHVMGNWRLNAEVNRGTEFEPFTYDELSNIELHNEMARQFIVAFYSYSDRGIRIDSQDYVPSGV